MFSIQSRHVHRVFGRGIRRGVGEVELGEVGGGHAGADGHGEYVDALVHAAASDGLPAQDVPVPRSKTTLRVMVSAPG